jgi:PAS domain S-box-containing protein
MTSAQILVVEDQSIAALDVKKRLESSGYTVVALASSGEEAIRKATELRPDLVLMDIRLRGEMDGVEAAEWIGAHLDIPVVYLTAYADEATLQRAKITEPFGYLLKPFEERTLHSTVEMALYRHKMERRVKESERWLATTLKSIGDAVIATDPQGCVRSMNPIAEALTGWKLEDALGMDLPDVFQVREGIGSPTENLARKALKDGAVLDITNHVLIAREGTEVIIDGNAAPIEDERGRITGAVLVFRDVTERVRLEECLQTIYQLGRELTLLHDETSITRRVLGAVAKVLRFERASCGLVDEATRELDCRYCGSDGKPEATRMRLPLDGSGAKSIGVAVVRGGRAINVPDTRQDVRYVPIPPELPVCSQLCVPIKAGERVIGVLCAESLEPNRFSSDDEQLLQTLADQAAVALENARLYNQIRQRIGELTALNKVSEAITGTLDWQKTLTIITDYTVRLLGAAAASVALRDEAKGDLWFAAASGKASRVVQDSRLALGQGLVGWVAQHGEPALIPDVREDPRFFAHFDDETGFTTHSILCVPLQTKGQTIGAIEAMNKEIGTFNQEDLRLLSSLAAPAATAIENARLHAETEQRATQLAVLHELDRAISASLRIDDVYYAYVHHAARLLPYDRLSINLLMGDEVQVAYVAGESDAVPLVGTKISRKASNINWVAARGQPLLRHSIAADTRFPGDEQLLASGVQSEMIIPLRVKGRVIGTWNISSRQVGAYNTDDLDIAQSMADQLAIAIENAQLFEAEQYARQTAETLRSANLALTQTIDLDTVLETLLDYLGRLVPYDSANVMLLEEGTRVAVRAVRGYENWTDPELARTFTFDSKANPVIQTMLRAQQSILIPDTYEHPDWSRAPGGDHVRNWLGVPLVAGGNLIGLYSLDKAQAGYFTQEHQRLAEALSAQAAVAIQNAQLFEQVRAGRERLQTLSRQLVEVQETERRHIARELHDQAGQALTSLMVGLRLLEQKVDRPEAILTQVTELKQMTNEVLEDLHQLAVDLRPASLDHLGLVAALRQHAETFSRQHDLVVQFETVGFESERPSPAVETAIYRIVQEALTNVVRHARATRVDVLLERRGDRVITIVEDDGLGFDPVMAMQRDRLGLPGMRERAEMLGGTLELESSAGTGTTLFVEMPYVHSDPDR